MCAFGAPAAKAKTTVALIGDSHTFHWRAALDMVARTKRWRGISIQEPGCYFSAAAKYLEGSEERCADWNRAVLAWLRKHHEVRAVFVSHGTDETIDAPRGRTVAQTKLSGFKRRWKSLPRSVKHVIVIRDNPKSTLATVNCVRAVVAAGIQRAGRTCRLRRYKGLSRDYGVVAAKRLHSKRYQYVDLTHYFCGPAYCYPVIGGAGEPRQLRPHHADVRHDALAVPAAPAQSPHEGLVARVPTAILFYDVVLGVHILAVVVAFGVVFAYPVIDAQIKRAGPANLVSLHRLHLEIARRVVTPAMVVVLVAGLYLALDRWSLGDPWISATFAILIVLFGLVGAVLTPTDKRLVALAERDAQAGSGPSPEYQRRRASPRSTDRARRCSSSSPSS